MIKLTLIQQGCLKFTVKHRKNGLQTNHSFKTSPKYRVYRAKLGLLAVAVPQAFSHTAPIVMPAVQLT